MAWLPVFYFRQVPLISEVKIIEILEVSSLLLFSLPLLDFVTVGSLQMFGRRGSGSEGDGSNDTVGDSSPIATAEHAHSEGSFRPVGEKYSHS